MSEESNKYSSSILTAKTPLEATEVIRIRLSQDKLIDKEFYSLFKELSDAQFSYTAQVRKIVTKHQDLDKLLEEQMVSNQVLTIEEMNELNMDSLGELRNIWDFTISELKNNIKSLNEFNDIMKNDVVIPLRDFSENDSAWNRSRRLHSKLTDVASVIDQNVRNNNNSMEFEEASKEWQTNAPYLFEMFQKVDYNHLENIKQSLLNYQSGHSDYLSSSIKICENNTSNLIDYEPENEIHRFSIEARNHSFKFASSSNKKSTVKKNSLSNSPNKDHSNRRRSTFTNISHRLTSSNNASNQDLMNDEFSDATNNNSMKNRKSSNRIKSTVGSIFGRNKLKNKSTQSFSKLGDATVYESSPVSSSRGSSRNDRHATTNTIRPELFSKGASSSEIPKKYAYSDNEQDNIFADTLPGTDTSEFKNGRPRFNTMSTTGSRVSAAYSTQSQNSAIQYQHPMDSHFVAISVNQTPLQPQQKSKQSVTEPNLSQPGFCSTSPNIGTLQMSAPKVPYSRKAFGSNSTSLSLPSFNQSASTLFSQITGELNVLDPQTTGPIAHVTGQSLFQHAAVESSIYGLNASIAEVINATFRDGIVTESQLIGEIALNHTPSPISKKTLPIGLDLKISNASKFDKIILNRAFVEQVQSEEFKVNPQFIESRTLGAIKYSISQPSAPIVIIPAWNFENHQASVVLTLKMSPTISQSVQQLILEDFSVSVSIDNANVSSALSKPQGTFSKENRRITWKFSEPVVLNRGNEETLIARFLTDRMSSESSKGVAAKFTIRESATQLIDVGSALVLHSQELDETNPFGGAWKAVSCTRTLSAGNYYGLSM